MNRQKIEEAIWDADTAIKRARDLLERAEAEPIRRKEGQTEYFSCRCGTPINYGDRFCRMCGDRIRWDK